MRAGSTYVGIESAHSATSLGLKGGSVEDAGLANWGADVSQHTKSQFQLAPDRKQPANATCSFSEKCRKKAFQ